MIRVVLPAHLRTLAKVDSDLTLEVKGPVTLRSVLDTLEARYPMLQGTIRDHDTLQRRAFLRFFACEEDICMSRPTPRCRKRSHQAKSRFSSLEPLPAAHAN